MFHKKIIKQTAYVLLAASSTLLGASSLLGQAAVLNPYASSDIAIQPRVLPTKPALIQVPPSARQDILSVQFKPGHTLRAYGGRIYDMRGIAIKAGFKASTVANTPAVDFTATQPILARLVGYWYPTHYEVSEDQLDTMRANGENNAGQEMPDLNAAMLVTVPQGIDIQVVPTPVVLTRRQALPFVGRALRLPLGSHGNRSARPTNGSNPQFITINIQEMAQQFNALDEVEYVDAIMPAISAAPNLTSYQDY